MSRALFLHEPTVLFQRLLSVAGVTYSVVYNGDLNSCMMAGPRACHFYVRG